MRLFVVLLAGLSLLAQTTTNSLTLQTPVTIQLSAPPAPLVLNYYVNANTGSDTTGIGTQHAPWKTIARAAKLVTSIAAGALVHVAPGDYPQALTLSNSGTATKRITFLSDVHWGAHISSAGVDRVVSLNGDYLTFQGFEVTGDSAARLGIIINGSYASVVDNHVHALPTANCTSNGGAGIDSASAIGHDNDILKNWVHDIAYGTNCTGIHGIYYANHGGTAANNVAYRVPGVGIHCWHGANSITITNNLVFEAGVDGILIGNGDSGAGMADHFVVSNNISINNGHYGITEFGSLVGPSNVYSDNVTYGNKAGGYHIISKAVPTGAVNQP